MRTVAFLCGAAMATAGLALAWPPLAFLFVGGGVMYGAIMLERQRTGGAGEGG